MPKLKVDLIVDDQGSIRVANFGKETQKAMELGSKHTRLLSGDLAGLAAKISAVGAVLAALGVGAGIKKSIDEFKSFQTSWTDMAKVTDRDLNQIRAEISALPPEIGNATELMQGYYQTISAGVTDPAESLQFLTGASKAAKAAHVDQSEVIKGLSKVMAGFQGQIEDVTQASDLMFAIEKEGQTTFAELVPVIGEVANASYQVKVSSDEMGAALALITQTAGSTSQAATQYRAVLLGLFKPQEKMTKLLGDLGYASGQAMVEELGLSGALKKVQQEAERTKVPIGKLFESSEALMGIAALSANNFDTYEAKIKAMGQAAGGTDRAFAAWEKTFAAVEEKFKNTISNMAIEFGEDLIPMMQEGIEGFGDYVLDNKAEILDFFTSLATAIGGVARASFWLAKKVDWIPPWAADMGTALGAVSVGDLDLSAVAGAGSPEELKKLVEGLGKNPTHWTDNSNMSGPNSEAFQAAVDREVYGVYSPVSPAVQANAKKDYQETIKPSPAAPGMTDVQISQAQDLYGGMMMGATDSFMGMPAAKKRAEEILKAQEELAKAEADLLKGSLFEHEKTTQEISQFWISAYRNMESVAGDFFFDAMQGNFDNLLDSFFNMTQRMVAEWMAAQAMMGMGKLGAGIMTGVQDLKWGGVDASIYPGVEAISHGGTTYTPKETTYLIDRGQRILSPNQNRDLTNFLRGQKDSGSSVQVNVINNANGTKAIATERLDGLGNKIIDVFIDALAKGHTPLINSIRGVA